MCSIAINFRFLFSFFFFKIWPACRPSQLKGVAFRSSARLARKLWKAVLL